jgi:HD-GYP domain-containing protein (c-di-GMP phosphodiesterase class II)
MLTDQVSRLQHYIEVIERANQIAATTQLDELLSRMLELFIGVTRATAGTLYLYDAEQHKLIFKVVKGNSQSEQLVGIELNADRGVAGYSLRQRQPIFIPDVSRHPLWDQETGELAGVQMDTMYCLPLLLAGEPIGIVQVFNLPAEAVDEAGEVAILRMLGNRLASEIEKARLLASAQHRERRQQALVDIISHISRTLDRDELLQRIMNHARDLLQIEATSIWLHDERNDELVLHLATGKSSDQLREVRVPSGQGIIGEVVRSGKSILVNDVHNDDRFYRLVDARSGFVTRSIFCVPLRSPRIQLGGERGEVQELTIGGAQALNKIDGSDFSEEDKSLFETLAGQAATVLRLAQLYQDSSELYLGLIDVITGALDQRDPDTSGHSQRVAEFAVAIAHELELSQELIYQIRIGGMLHDIGKIGIPDAILTKPAALTTSEIQVIKSHPSKGSEILQKNQLIAERLRNELLAVLEHHERLDGRGYPRGLRGDEISQIGRIMAVADVFDAMTSDRRYRAGMPPEQVIRILQASAGTEFDHACVEAFCRAREKGKILTQQER